MQPSTILQSTNLSLPPTLDRPEPIRRIEAIRTESAKIAAEHYFFSRKLSHDVTSAALQARLQLLAKFQQDVSDMISVEIEMLKPLLLTGRETGPTDVPLLLVKSIREEEQKMGTVRRLAREGDMANARVVSKDIVRIQKMKQRLYVMDATNKLRTVKTMLAGVEGRVGRIEQVADVAARETFGENMEAGEDFVGVLTFCSGLVSDLMVLERYEMEVLRQLKGLASENLVEACRTLATALVEVRKWRGRVMQGVERILEKAVDESLKAAIRYIHPKSAELAGESSGAGGS